jgi:hypothetical protein
VDQFDGRLREPSLPETKQREHAASATFFGTVRVIKVGMTSCADAAVVDFEHAFRSTLFQNFGREINLVMRRANTGAELND